MQPSSDFVLVVTHFQMAVIIGFVALYAVAAALVLRRIGFSMWWALLCFVPIAALAGLWALALSGWTSPRTDAG